MQAVFIDIDNTLLDFEEYVKQSMKTGFEHFGLKPYNRICMTSLPLKITSSGA